MQILLKRKDQFTKVQVNRERIESRIETGASTNTMPMTALQNVACKPTEKGLVVWSGARVYPQGETMHQIFRNKNGQYSAINFVMVDRDDALIF